MKNKSKGKKTNHNHTQQILLTKIALHLNYLSDRRNPNNGYAHYEMGPWKKKVIRNLIFLVTLSVKTRQYNFGEKLIKLVEYERIFLSFLKFSFYIKLASETFILYFEKWGFRGGY